MGHYKQMMEEWYGRGGWDLLGKAVCRDCLTGIALKELAKNNLDECRCDYCGREGEDVACDTDVVMTRIGEGLAEDFTEPNEVLYYGDRTAPRSVREFVDRVPTQIVSEYFRTVYAAEDGALDGILYRSAEDNRGVCCALFVPRQRCVDRAAAATAERA